MSRYTQKTTVTRSEYLQLTGLLVLAHDTRRRLDALVTEVEKITGEEIGGCGHGSDACYSGYTADELLEKHSIKVVDGPTELSQWQQYASYCNCCAKSGEHTPMDFDAFVQSLESATI